MFVHLRRLERQCGSIIHNHVINAGHGELGIRIENSPSASSSKRLRMVLSCAKVVPHLTWVHILRSYKCYITIFCNHMERKQNRPFTRPVFPYVAKNGLGMRLPITVITYELRTFSSIPMLISFPTLSAFSWYLTLAFKGLIVPARVVTDTQTHTLTMSTRTSPPQGQG